MNVVSIKEFDDILDALHQQGKSAGFVSKEQANATMLQAYENSKRAGNARLDFNDII